jgi:hypothetical protein
VYVKVTVQVDPAEQLGVGFEETADAVIGERNIAIKPKSIRLTRILNITRV